MTFCKSAFSPSPISGAWSSIATASFSRDFLSDLRLCGSALASSIRRYLVWSLHHFVTQKTDVQKRIRSVGDPESAEAVSHLAQRDYQRWALATG